MKPLVTLRRALEDPNLLGQAIPGPSWLAWRVLLIAAMGEPLTDEERPLFTALTGRETEPFERVEEVWALVGRRGGKTRAAGAMAAYISCLCDHSAALAPGERGLLPILAASQTQATRAFQHTAGIIRHSPGLSFEIEDELGETLRLKTGIDIQIRPANFRTIRGVTSVAAIVDEVSYWLVEGTANPDVEILDALRPSLATTEGMLIGISSPYGRRGELYNVYRRDFGPDGDPRILVAKGASRVFNPSLPQRIVDRAYQRDPASAVAEYGGEFRTDVEATFTREAVEACISDGVHERAPISGITYHAFVDPSGGIGDSMTLGISHAEDGVAVIDATRERRPPLSPEGVVKDFADLLKLYGVRAVRGDRYGGEWPREQFRKHGIGYVCSDRTKSDLFQAAIPAINSKLVDLLDDERVVLQFIGLERRTARGGRDSIDHSPGGHDDLVNAVAGAINLAIGKRPAVSARQLVGSRSAYAPSSTYSGASSHQ